MNQTDPSGIEEYQAWLRTIDPRISQVLIDLDDEYCTGRVGTRQRFVGDLEFRLMLTAKDGKDFIEMMKIAQRHRDPFEAEEHARLVWNVALNFSNMKTREFANLITSRSK